MAPVKRIPVLYARARQLRTEMPPAERVLWSELRNRRFGTVTFRRQQPLGCYIADFFCASARLVVELDGDSHMGQEERDAQRQVYIESHDIRVIRFWNFEVYENLNWVLDSIGLALDQQLAARLAAKTEAGLPFVLPSPLAGEGGSLAHARLPGEGRNLRGQRHSLGISKALCLLK